MKEVQFMEEREFLIYLHSLNGIGWKTISRLHSYLDSLNRLYDIQPLELSMTTGIELQQAEKIRDALQSGKVTAFNQLVKKWKEKGINILTYLDPDYPQYLKEIAQPPWVIYTIGRKELLQQLSIAMVGTRNPTNYGKIVANKLAKELVESGFVVVSGLARGIDSISHSGAISANGPTIAVLGSGIDVIYPSENKKLYNEIVAKGLIISEYPPNTAPHPGFFPQRNRIISGLAYGTIIVEASMKSGSLITAQFALDQSREVFAVPGPITSKQSLGTNSLIKQGAKLVQTIDDILEEFPYISLNGGGQKSSLTEKLTDSEALVYELIDYNPIHIDEIYSKLDLNLSEIYEALFSLQLKNMIKQVSGGSYIQEL